MTFWRELVLCLCWRPRQALLALYWFTVGKRVRARNCLRRDSHAAPYAYDLWQVLIERPRVDQLVSRTLARAAPDRPKFTIIITEDADPQPDLIDRSVNSVVAQHWPNWELLRPDIPAGDLAGPADLRIRPWPKQDRSLSAAIAGGRGEFIIFLRAGSQMPRWALAQYASSLAEFSGAAIVYGDQDCIDARGARHSPWFKPLWNMEMFLAQDYLTAACCVDAELARSSAIELGDAAPVTPFSLVLALTGLSGRAVVRARQILVHVDEAIQGKDHANRVAATRRHLAASACEVVEGPFSTQRIHWPLPPTPPRVSIIIPTRDRVALVRTCVESILAATDYPNYEILIVDNDSVEADTHRFFQTISRLPNVRVMTCSGEFNFSVINNRAVQEATGEFVCFLNNDTEVIGANWLSELVRQGVRPHVGAVGAMLLYGDRTVQHAGVVIGLGQAAGHAHRGLAEGAAGYFSQAHIQRYVSAVTAACLLVSRDKFLAVGGFDEIGFAIAYNDVDLCLKLGKAGWQNVYAPQAVLFHHESKSRGNDLAPANLERYLKELALLQDRWGTRTAVDPLHHPDLDRRDETYSFRLQDENT